MQCTGVKIKISMHDAINCFLNCPPMVVPMSLQVDVLTCVSAPVLQETSPALANSPHGHQLISITVISAVVAPHPCHGCPHWGSVATISCFSLPYPCLLGSRP